MRPGSLKANFDDRSPPTIKNFNMTKDIVGISTGPFGELDIDDF